MAQIYFNGISVDVVEDYEEICEDVFNAGIRKENFIELNEFHKKFEEGNSRFVTTRRKIYVRIDSIQYIQS